MADREIRQNQYDIELPQPIIESFDRFLVPEIRKYYDSEQGQQEFAEWQEAQEKHKK
ncbi:MAG: hypothetical protein ACLSB9_29365 [Hydrogeniiclostridium mannosilyticum]